MEEPTYTLEEKQAFLDAVRRIAEAVHDIREIDDGNIINHVGLSGYPFN